jgi:predicted regulator of Ras-like GTPase activity (Roadblock/LC7/MglB family)
MRDDQEKALTGKDFETPFAIKAKEDAERFRVGPAPAPEVSTKSASERQAEAKIDSAPKEKIDGKQVLARACKLPGVDACEIMFSDGLSLAGNFPPEISASGLCAMAPTSLQRIDTHMRESRLGTLTAMTLHSTNSAITFFMKESICLAALHSDSAALAPDTRAQLGELVEELSRIYAQPETPHVDH